MFIELLGGLKVVLRTQRREILLQRYANLCSEKQNICATPDKDADDNSDDDDEDDDEKEREIDDDKEHDREDVNNQEGDIQEEGDGPQEAEQQ